MRVVGIDPGTATTGYGVIEESAGRLTLIAFGRCAPAPNFRCPAAFWICTIA